MMNNDIARRVASLIGRRASFRVEEGELRCRAPKGALDANDHAFIRDHLAEIIQLLTDPLADRSGSIWWGDEGYAAPILWIPEQATCIAPRACSRLGPCPCYVPGLICDITKRPAIDQRDAA